MAEDHVEMTEAQRQSVNKALNDALWEKLRREQECFKAELLEQPAEIILKNCFLYAVREDIFNSMDFLELSDLQAAALLNRENPLQEAADWFRANSERYMEDVFGALSEKADELIKGQPLQEEKQDEESAEDEEEQTYPDESPCQRM